MCSRGRRFCLQPCSSEQSSWSGLTGRLTTIFAVLFLTATLSGCSALRQESPNLRPSVPVLKSQKIVILDDVRGWWIDERDAAALAQWIFDMSGESGQ